MLGVGFSRGGMDINGMGVGPTVAAIRPPYGPTGTGVTGGEPLTRRERGVTSSAAVPAAAGAPGLSPLVVVGGFIGLGFVLWLLRKNSSYLQQNTIGFNTYNTLYTAVVSVVGILLLKIGFNRFPVPGVTPVVNAV